ncbi:hypothetical protein EDC18_103322 [Natranaerovirga pectinivora]|uniref:Uncharacterized protein n=1 Tax=Natranaerovirga pectinivora TaxID=682400 RepID=A0A4R3MNJ4_9FIRM|nr:hypothetical protein [Natranaerovirga pectinivora]TCT15614.1 hypothetical protein EDC18_103322 [Natranaerovirga pectinivora]
MKDLYVENAIWGRFNNPEAYLQSRKETEKWLRQAFIAKGGCPQEEYPLYMVAGTSNMLNNTPYEELSKIQVPISYFNEEDISFTYIDSMFSYQLGKDKSSKYYQPKYHRKVFLLSEIRSIFKEQGEPVEGWWGKLPSDFLPYIEAQVWNHKLIRGYLERNSYE